MSLLKHSLSSYTFIEEVLESFEQKLILSAVKYVS